MTSFKPRFPSWPLAVSFLLLATGCAKGPSGGATNTAPNRLEATLTIDKTIDPNFYYGVAFDDSGTTSAGPKALEGNTAVLNGVMGGTWRVFVLYHLNQFQVFYRGTPDDPDTERRIVGTALFFQQPRASGSSIDFVMNLDAKIDSNTFFFQHTAPTTLSTDTFNINYAATNTIIISSQDQRTKPVDADGASTLSTPFQFQVASTRRISRQDSVGDARFYDTSFASVNFGQIDVTQLDLNLIRSTN